MIEKICENYLNARTERHDELTDGGIGDKTLEYHGLGCYECSGFDLECVNYVERKDDRDI